MRPASRRRYVEDNPEIVAMLRRVFEAADDRVIPSRVRPEDKAALAAWVTDRVMNSPIPKAFDWWPPRFEHRRPHRDLVDFRRTGDT